MTVYLDSVTNVTVDNSRSRQEFESIDCRAIDDDGGSGGGSLTPFKDQRYKFDSSSEQAKKHVKIFDKKRY